MRYAILSDVHANEAALRVALTDAADERVERIVCLGDVLGYGPDPVSALELVYRRCHVCLAGNHDDAVSGRCAVEDFTDFAAQAVARHRAALSRKAIDWLRQLPHVCEFPGHDGRSTGSFACAHGDFSDPKNFNYVLEPPDAMPSWLERAEQLLFVGHTHDPGIFVLGPSGRPHGLAPDDFVLEEGKRYLVNVGSVGYPRSGACRSCYCIYDDVSRSVFFRSLPFDIEGYRAKMHGQGLHEAPWLRARELARRRPEVRNAEDFGRFPRENRARTSEAKEELSRPRRGLLAACALGGAVLAGVGTWCALRAGRAVPAESATAPGEVEIATAVPDEEGPPPVDAAPAEVGPVVAQRRCTVPAGGRLRFVVKLRRGSVPAWVHVRFEDGNGAPAGDGLWYQNVKASKRSPKAGLVAPAGATAAFLEVVRAHEGDVCDVAEMTLESL